MKKLFFITLLSSVMMMNASEVSNDSDRGEVTCSDDTMTCCEDGTCDTVAPPNSPTEK